jgi:MoaA/NifB/PqqE/SkfB family radical SAM enzyme
MEKKDRMAVIELNDYCLNRCLHCSSCGSPTGKNLMKLDDYYSIIDTLLSLDYRRIILSGGEPLLNDNIYEFVEYAYNKKLSVYLYTSGISKNIENVKICLKHIEKIIVSLYALKAEIHDFITCNPGSFEKTLDFIKYLFANKIPYEINTVAMKNNINDIVNIVEADIGEKADKINVLKLVIQGNAITNRNIIEPTSAEIENLLNVLTKYSDVKLSHSFDYTKGSCDAYEKMCFTSDGYLLPCEAFKGVRQNYPKFTEINLKKYLEATINSTHHDCAYALCQIGRHK